MTKLDRRHGERWTRVQRLKNGALYTLARVTLAAARGASREVLAALGEALGKGAFHALPRERHRAIAQLRAALGVTREEADALARETFVTLGRELGLAVAALAGEVPPPLPLADDARLTIDQAIAEGRGVVFASAHLAPWERVAETLAAAGIPFVAVARESYDPRFTKLYEEMRRRHGVACIYRGRPGAAARMLRALRSGAVLGVPMDLKTRVPSVPIPFLGAPAPTATGPARLARLTGAAVVVGSIAPAGDAPEGLAVTARRLDVRGLEVEAVLTAINDELSGRIRALPTRWPWMHARF